MNDNNDNNTNGNDADAETESVRILAEIQARLDANDLTQTEMQKMMLRFEFQLARMRQEITSNQKEAAANHKYITAHLRHLTDLVGIVTDKSFATDAKFERLRDALTEVDPAA